MPLDNINYSAGQDSMEEVFDKTNEAIDRINAIYENGELPNGIMLDSTNLIKFVRIQIGDWNMDTTPGVTISLGSLTRDKILFAQAWVRDDVSGLYTPLDAVQNFIGGDLGGGQPEPNGGIDYASQSAGNTNILLSRRTSGNYDNDSYDSTSYNRGYINIFYLAV